jgi:diguanylate cyclase
MLDVLVVCTAVFVGLVGGWWLRGNDPRLQRMAPTGDEPERTREVLERLRDLTRNVAADVDQHQALMGRISDELHASEDQEPAIVLKAVNDLIESNERMQQQLNSAEAKLQTQAKQLVNHAVEARTDALTSLANRRQFDQVLQEACQAMAKEGLPTTIMMLDIDHFKNLNDSYGHQAGDAVLQGVAQVLRQRVPEGNLVARYGGEEFAVVFPAARLAHVQQLAEQVRRAVGEATLVFQGVELHVTISAGLAELQPRETAASVVGRSDDALYASKDHGRDCTHAHNGQRVVRIELAVSAEPGARGAKEKPAPAPHDTGISSPAVFSSDVRRRLTDWRSGGAPLCLLFVQIDDLDEIRRRHGDDNGNAAIRALTLTLKAAMREIDHAARFEGDALSLLLPGCTLRGAIAAAERLRRAAARCTLHSRYDQRNFTVSIGAAEALVDENEDALIDRVRASLNVARQHGQDCTYIHDGTELRLIGAGQLSLAH